MPSYRDNPKRMENLFINFFFATHTPTWTDVQSLLNILFTSEEHITVLDKAMEEVDQLHTVPGKLVREAARVAVPAVDPNWDVNARDRLKVEHY